MMTPAAPTTGVGLVLNTSTELFSRSRLGLRRQTFGNTRNLICISDDAATLQTAGRLVYANSNPVQHRNT
jgi:hypothetical protein